MRADINKWINSPKYKAFKQELEEKKQELFELKTFYMNKENDNDLSPKELFEYIKVLKDIYASKDGTEDYDDDYFKVVGEKKEILSEYKMRQYAWFVHLGRNLLNEEYELCAEIRDIIILEEKEFIELIDKYMPHYSDDIPFLESIIQVNIKFTEIINSRVCN
jgi:hypothetical protein